MLLLYSKVEWLYDKSRTNFISLVIIIYNSSTQKNYEIETLTIKQKYSKIQSNSKNIFTTQYKQIISVNRNLSTSPKPPTNPYQRTKCQ